MKGCVVSLEVSTLYSDWLIRISLPAVRELHGVSIEGVTSLRAVFSVRVIVQEGGQVLEE